MILNERLSVYLSTLAATLPEFLEQIEKEAIRDHVPIIRKDMQNLLRFLLHSKNPDNVLEIGTAVGFSALLMRENIAPASKLTTIEKVPARIRAARENFQRAGKSEAITLLEGDADSVLGQLAKEQQQYDFIFMDAAKGQYMHFLSYIEKLLVPGGMLVTDNVLQDGMVMQSRYAVTRRDRTIHKRMRQYLYTLTHDKKWETVVLPVGDGAALSLYRGSGEDTLQRLQ